MNARSMKIVLLLAAILIFSSVSQSAELCQDIFNPLAELEMPKNDPAWYHMFPRDMPIRKFIDENGDMYLFRVNGGPWIPGKTGFYSKDEGAVSTSLSPSIVYNWVSPDWGSMPVRPIPHVMILKQNFNKNDLDYPDRNGAFLRGPYRHNKLKKDTKIGNISFYDEIKVKNNEINLVAEVPSEVFKRILEEEYAGKGPFTPKELAERIMSEFPKNP